MTSEFLIRCVFDPFNHIVNLRHLQFNNTIALAVIIPHKVEYCSPNEIDGSEIRVSVMEG